MRSSTVTAALAAVAMLSIPAAQAQQNLNRSERPPSSSPSSRTDCLQPDIGPRSTETTGSQSLSDQLSQSKGVICPPAGVDPGIAVPLVGGGRMPVIPPPGSPGGDPYIQPK